jgi:hypothetical protein
MPGKVVRSEDAARVMVDPGAEVALEELLPSRREAWALEDLVAEATIVYLGNNPNHTAVLQGTTRYVGGDSDADAIEVPADDVEGLTTYTFNRFDSRQRLVRERIMPDGDYKGRVHTKCRHLGHIVWFREARDADGGMLYKVLATRQAGKRVEAYARMQLESQLQSADSGRPVLQAMGLDG